MNSLVKYLDCGIIREVPRRPTIDFIVKKFSDFDSKIIPLFDNYPLQGIKSLNFEDFCKIAYLMKDKAYLTVEGFEQIRSIKSGMNTGRN
jgi:hypothetical protein